MRKINIVELILVSMPPIENEIQESIEEYLQLNQKECNFKIINNPKYAIKINAISSMLIEVASDFGKENFDKALLKKIVEVLINHK